MIVNGGSNYPGTGGTYGSISLGGNAAFNLSPATSGTYAGIVFFQPGDNTKALTVSGNASGITGTIYAPGAALSEGGNAALNASLIVKRLAISGNGIANGPSQAGPASAGISSDMVATSGGATATTSSIGAVAVLDQTAPATIPVKLKVKVTDALGNNVSASSLPVVSMAAAGSAGNLVPQTAPGSSLPDSLFTFDPTSGTSRFNLKTKGSRLGSSSIDFLTAGEEPTLSRVRMVIGSGCLRGPGQCRAPLADAAQRRLSWDDCPSPASDLLRLRLDLDRVTDVAGQPQHNLVQQQHDRVLPSARPWRAC